MSDSEKARMLPNDKIETLVDSNSVTTTPETSDCGSCLETSKYDLVHVLEDIALSLKKQGTSKRGKRRNVAQLFITSIPILQEKVDEIYKDALFSDEIFSGADIDIHLQASTLLLEQFFLAQMTIAPILDYLPTNLHEEGYLSPEAFVFGFVETCIVKNFLTTFHGSTNDSIDCVQSLVVASWIKNVLIRLDDIYPMIKKSQVWLTEYSKHTNNFLDSGFRSKANGMLQCVASMWCNDSECEGPNNQDFVRNSTEMVVSVVDVNISLAKRYLKDSLIADIMTIFNEEMTVMVADVMVVICTKWMTLGISQICSIVKAAEEMIDVLGERNDKFLTTTESKEAGIQTIRDLEDLSKCVVNFLCERILQQVPASITLQRNIGSSEWESNEDGTAVSNMLHEFRQIILRTYNLLSSSYYFPKLLKKCFNLILQSYMESFYINTMTSGITNSLLVASNLNRDYLCFVTFFNSALFEQYQGIDGFYTATEVNQRLQVIQCMSRLTNPTVSPSDLADDAMQLMAFVSDNNTDHTDCTSILHIAGLRSSCRDSNESITEWNDLIESIQSSDKWNDISMSDRIKLPDLRNSLYVQTMQQQDQEEQSLLSQNGMHQKIQIGRRQRFDAISHSVEKSIQAIVHLNKGGIEATTTAAAMSKSQLVNFLYNKAGRSN